VPVSATDALKFVLREVVGPALRPEGFKGSGPTWTLTAPNSDRAVVNVQSSQFSSKTEVRCMVNIAVVPEPWWAWQVFHQGKAMTKSPKEYHGLWRQRLQPSSGGQPRGSEVWWSIRDQATAREAAADIVSQLRTDAVPLLQRLLERDAMLAAVRAGDLGFITGQSSPAFFDRALAVLLADQGQSAELDALLARFLAEQDENLKSFNESFVPWLTARAASRGHLE
jgi:Domain of unknown function (DUF4304)